MSRIYVGDAAVSASNPVPTALTAGTAAFGALTAGEAHVGEVGGKIVTPTTSTTRPADVTAYAVGDLVANSTTAASVVALSFTSAGRIASGNGAIVGASIQKSTNVTTSVALRLHLFTVVPTFVTSGDNTAMTTVVVASAKGYLGYIDVPAFTGFSDVAWGSGAPDNSRGLIPFVAAATPTIFGVLEARGAFTPASAEVFTVFLGIMQN